MKLGNLTMEISVGEVVRAYADKEGVAFITNDLIQELLSIPEVNARMIFHPRTMLYGRNPYRNTAEEDSN